MSDDDSNGQDLPAVRSLNCDTASFVHFVSRTHRKVDILWIDYEGKHVKYATLKNKGEVMEMRTYVTHPWVFQDADTGDQLVTLGGGEVFFPKEPLDDDEDRPDRVLVGIPVYSLKTRCLQAVKQLFEESQISQLSIPRTLQDDLRKNNMLDSTFYENYEVVGD